MPLRIQVKMPDELKGTGFPTFEEFCRNPDRYRTKKDWVLGAIDEAGHSHRHLLKSHKDATYEILGRTVKTLEEVERIANGEGYPIDHLEAKVKLLPDHGGSGSQKKARVHVVFTPKLLYTSE